MLPPYTQRAAIRSGWLAARDENSNAGTWDIWTSSYAHQDTLDNQELTIRLDGHHDDSTDPRFSQRGGPMAAVVPSDDHRPIVGRANERAQLLQILDTTLTSAGRLVLVSGEAGIGKTTLIEDVARKAAERDMLVLSAGCYDLTTTPPYGPWVEILRAYPVTTGLRAPPVELRERGGSEQLGSQEHLFRIVADFLSEIAAVTPVILILEDLHWADHASLDLLRFLARQVTRQRLLLLVSYRDEELNRDHPLFTMLPMLVREARAQRIELERFDAETLRGLVAQQYELVGHDGDALATYLLRHTEGNPLFVVELLRSLERERVLVTDKNGWQVGELEEVVPPPLVVQMIERHLTELEPGTREALEVAAVLGQEIDTDLWQPLAALDDARLLTTIEQAVSGRLIETLSDRGLRFRHALIREVLYQGMLFPKRQRLHRAAAELLVEGESPDPDAVAYHFQQAGDERAIEWLIRAGDHADLAEAHFSAMERYEAALRLLEDDEPRMRERGWLLLALGQTARDIVARQALNYTEEAQRIGEVVRDDALAAWALYFLGEHRFFVGQNGLSEMEQGLALIQALPPDVYPALPSRFGRHYKRNVDSHAMDSNVVLMQALFGRYRDALEGAEKYLARNSIRDSFQWGLCGHAESARACALSALGDPEGSTAAYHLTQSAYQQANWTWHRALTATLDLQYVTLIYRADEPAVRQHKIQEVEGLWTQVSGITTQLPPRFGLLPLLVVEGRWSEARDLALPFATGEVAFYYIGLYALGIIARAQGDADLARAMVQTGLPVGPDTEPGSIWMNFTIELQCLAAELALDDEDLAVARRWIEAFDRWLEWSERVQGCAEAQLLWARYHRVAGDLDTGHHHAEQALEYARDPRQPLALIAAYRMLGELETERGHYPNAGQHLRHALDWADACAAPYEQALTLFALADLGVATGDPDAAWRHLDQARAICARLDAQPALQRATEIAARLAVRRGKPMYPAGLTPREVAVLKLVADGLSDAEVGERLFISPRTVNSHLTSIYNKLGVSSRVEAARFAFEQGMLD